MRIRDNLMHAAQLPRLKGYDAEVGRRIAWTVIFHVLPDIVMMGLSRVLGMGARSQRFDHLLLGEFFEKGTYNGYHHSYDIGPF
jgi:hypothetical protein